MKTISNLAKKLSWARLITRCSYGAFILVLIVGSVTSKQPLSLLIFALIPLLIFIPALIKEGYKSLSLLCFVILMYFMVTVVNLFSPDKSVLDFIELFLEIILFTSSMLFSRWKQYSLYQLPDAT